MRVEKIEKLGKWKVFKQNKELVIKRYIVASRVRVYKRKLRIIFETQKIVQR